MPEANTNGATETAEATVVQGDFDNVRRIGLPCVRFDVGTTLQSPCFWIIVGAAGTLALMYMFQKNR